jgi:hypothetical protein
LLSSTSFVIPATDKLEICTCLLPPTFLHDRFKSLPAVHVVKTFPLIDYPMLNAIIKLAPTNL